MDINQSRIRPVECLGFSTNSGWIFTPSFIFSPLWGEQLVKVITSTMDKRFSLHWHHSSLMDKRASVCNLCVTRCLPLRKININWPLPQVHPFLLCESYESLSFTRIIKRLVSVIYFLTSRTLWNMQCVILIFCCHFTVGLSLATWHNLMIKKMLA